MNNRKSKIIAVALSSILLTACEKPDELQDDQGAVFSVVAETSSEASPTMDLSKKVVARFAGHEITEEMLLRNIASSVYEAEKKIFDLKMANLRNLMLDTIIAADGEKALNRQQYIEKHITNEIQIADEDVSAFIKKRKIPDEKVSPELLSDIKQYLFYAKEAQAIDDFVAQKSYPDPVEIYITKPLEQKFEADISTSPTLGSSDAAVTIIEYSDFQCPYCKQGALIVDQILEKYGDQVKLVFKNFPLQMHRDAYLAAQAGMCAYMQGADAFWDMHDKMFSAQNRLTQPDLIASAEAIGLETAAFTDCLNNGDTRHRVDQDLQDGANAKIRSTPSYFINGKYFSGLLTFEEFSALIEEALAAVAESQGSTANGASQY